MLTLLHCCVEEYAFEQQSRLVAEADAPVCCSTRALGELDERFQFKSNKSRLVPEDTQGRNPINGIDDSQFEGESAVVHTVASPGCLKTSCCIAVCGTGAVAIIISWSDTSSHVDQALYGDCAPLCVGITHLRDTDTLLVVKEEAGHGGAWPGLNVASCHSAGTWQQLSAHMTHMPTLWADIYHQHSPHAWGHMPHIPS